MSLWHQCLDPVALRGSLVELGWLYISSLEYLNYRWYLGFYRQWYNVIRRFRGMDALELRSIGALIPWSLPMMYTKLVGIPSALVSINNSSSLSRSAIGSPPMMERCRRDDLRVEADRKLVVVVLISNENLDASLWSLGLGACRRCFRNLIDNGSGPCQWWYGVGGWSAEMCWSKIVDVSVNVGKINGVPTMKIRRWPSND